MNDYERIARVIRHLDDAHVEQPDLTTLARRAGLSSFHFHRLFTTWAGVTPKDFLQCLTLAHAKRLIREGESILDAALDSGLSGAGRLHDLCVNLEAASPGEIKSGGAGWTISFGFVATPFGKCMMAESPRGICRLVFVEDKAVAQRELAQEWPHAVLKRDDAGAGKVAAKIFSRGRRTGAPLRALVQGTDFQVRVWRALLQIPPGSLVSYGRLAEAVGQPNAARAVGTAVGANALAYLIPCHRVIRETGVFGNYRWGPIRKRAIVTWEGTVRRGADLPAMVSK